MKSAIGMTSASSAQRTARVWNRNEPTPTTATRALSRRAGLSPVRARRTCAAARAAAIRKAPFDRALTGSAQKPGSLRSQ
jgi:hypothetical protein